VLKAYIIYHDGYQEAVIGYRSQPVFYKDKPGRACPPDQPFLSDGQYVYKVHSLYEDEFDMFIHNKLSQGTCCQLLFKLWVFIRAAFAAHKYFSGNAHGGGAAHAFLIGFDIRRSKKGRDRMLAGARHMALLVD